LGEPVFVVFNPRSGKGRGARLVQPVLAALARPGVTVEHALTAQAGHEGELAERAIASGFRKIVAVGGDGTWSNVANGVLRSGQPATLGLVPGGTGCDLAKSLDIPGKDLAACAAIIHDGAVRAIDVGCIEGRYFLNCTGFGYDIAVIEDSWRVTWLQGELLYLYCALKQLHSYRGLSVQVEADGVDLGRKDLLMLILANGRVFGGGFKIAPQADLGDGRLDVSVFGNTRLPGRMELLVRLLRGTHARASAVQSLAGSRFRLRFDRPPAYETDGEWNQAQSADLTIETLPGALRVLVPASSSA
jgi:YegS/Rv2252/BmrU family lipid kinase